MKRQAIGVAAFSLAWVLWAEYHAAGGAAGFYTPERWRIVNAYSSKTACDGEQRAHMADMTEEGWRVMGVNTGERAVGDLLISYRYLCLPGTLDPRPRN